LKLNEKNEKEIYFKNSEKKIIRSLLKENASKMRSKREEKKTKIQSLE
jgi:hypothetical protein